MAVADPTTETRLITGEEFARMIGYEHCELVNGRIVTMTPPGFEHGDVEGNVYSVLREFVRANKLGKVAVGEVGIFTNRKPDSVRAADVLFISNERYAQRQSQGYLDVAPELVVEILSPSNSWSEMKQKLREYFAIGVKLVWLVDLPSQSVSAYRSLTDVREFAGADELPGDDVLPGFSVAVASLFED